MSKKSTNEIEGSDRRSGDERRIAGITALVVEYGIALHHTVGFSHSKDFLKSYGIDERVIQRVLESPNQRRSIGGMLSWKNLFSGSVHGTEMTTMPVKDRRRREQ